MCGLQVRSDNFESLVTRKQSPQYREWSHLRFADLSRVIPSILKDRPWVCQLKRILTSDARASPPLLSGRIPGSAASKWHRPFGRVMPPSSNHPRIWLMTAVRHVTQRSRARCKRPIHSRFAVVVVTPTRHYFRLADDPGVIQWFKSKCQCGHFYGQPPTRQSR